MSDRSGLRRLFRLPPSRTRVRHDVEEEIGFHIEQRTRELIDDGMPEAGAAETAGSEFGDLDAARFDLEAIGHRRLRREQRSNRWGDFVRDLRHGVHSALHAPAFSLLAIVTLALGIGANAAVIGVAKPLLLDPLPFVDADALVRVYGSRPDEGTTWGLTAGMVDDTVRMQTSFASHAAFMSGVQQVVLDREGGVGQVLSAAWVEPRFFDVLGTVPVVGRRFVDADAPSEVSYALIITHGAWQRLFAADPAVVGREVSVNDRPRQVVGVLPPDFIGPLGAADFYFPLNLAPTLADPVSVRRSHWVGMIARLLPTSSIESTQQQLDTIARQLATRYPDDFTGIGMVATPLQRAMVGDVRTPLLVLLASAALVLLIACANLSGALLSRSVARRKEFGVRAALGASRGRLVRQLLTESIVLAVAGGIAAIALSVITLALLRGFAAESLPHFADIQLDAAAIVATMLLTVFTGVLVGGLPAFAVARGGPQGALADSSRGGSESRTARRLRGLLVAGQISLCLALVVSAGLLGRSLWNMATATPGFEPAGVLAASLQLPSTRYVTPTDALNFQQRVVEQLQSTPGVEAVAIADAVPRAINESNSFVIDGAPWPAGKAEPFVMWTTVSDGYFNALRIPLRQGREFDARDHLDAPLAIIINESMARSWWPEGDALGARIRIGPDREAPWHTVVGIAGDVRHDPSSDDPSAITYVPIRQAPSNQLSVLLRSRGDPLALQAPLERVIAAVDPTLPLRRITTLEAVLGERLAAKRLPVVLMLGFGALALTLASVGVYAMFATMAASREREFSVRIALGADGRAIAGLILRQGGIWLAMGLAGGVVGVVIASMLLRGLLFGVSAFDPGTLIIAITVLVACALLASLPPVRRACRVDPAVALQRQ